MNVEVFNITLDNLNALRKTARRIKKDLIRNNLTEWFDIISLANLINRDLLGVVG